MGVDSELASKVDKLEMVALPVQALMLKVALARVEVVVLLLVQVHSSAVDHIMHQAELVGYY